MEFRRLKIAKEQGRAKPLIDAARGGSEDTKSFAHQLGEMVSRGATEAKISSFVDKCVQELTDSSKPCSIDVFTGKVLGFIHPDTTVVLNMLFATEGFRVDDGQIYHDMAKKFAQLAEKHPDANDRTLVLNTVFHTIYQYLGTPVFTANVMEKLHRVYDAHNIVDSEAEGPVSMQELKGKNLAMCMESSAVAQNLFTVMGIESTMVISPHCELGHSSREGHAYILLHTDDKYLLFDQVNPFFTRDDAGKIVGVHPAKYELSKDEYEELLGGGKVKVNFLTFDRAKNVTREEVWLYAGPVSV